MERDKCNLDILWLKDDNDIDLNNLPNADDLLDEIIENMGNAMNNLQGLKESLN